MRSFSLSEKRCSIGTLLTIPLVAALLLMSAACGGSSVDCGPNTTNDNGVCRPAEGAYSCGGGTSVGPDGECTVDDAGCGPNLVFNASVGQCVPDRQACRDGAEFDPESDQCEAAVGCGTGTILENGVCQPDSDALCGSGAVRYDAESDRCVVDVGACGDGTKLSAQGTCVADVSSCGRGTALAENGECVPTDEVCDGTTVFDPDNQLCVPSRRCQQGDVVLNADSGPGVCVSPARKLAADADVSENESSSASHNDPTLGGTARALGTVTEDDTVSFTGTIASPQDRNGDGQLDQDRDGFSFEATANTWVEISVQSTGLPAPWFQIRGPRGFHRSAPVGRDAARQLMLPFAGNYTILVAPAADSGSSADGPFGNDDWSYVGEVAGMTPPTSNAGSLSPRSTRTGNLPTLQDNLYTLDGFSGGDFVRLTTPEIGEDVSGTVRYWTPGFATTRTARVSSGDAMYVRPPGGQSPFLLVDWSTLDGPADSYSLRAARVSDGENLGTLAAGGDTAAGSSHTVNAGDSFLYAVSAPADHVLEITHANQQNEDATVVVRDALGQPLTRQPDLPANANIDSSGEDDDGYMWLADDGLYIIEVQTDDKLTNHTITLQTHDPGDLGSGTPGDTLTGSLSSTASQYRSNWFVFDAQQPVTAKVSADGSVSSGDPVDFDTALFSLADEPSNLTAGEGELRFAAGTDSVTLDSAGLKPGRYLVRVGLADTIDTIDVTTELTSPPALEQEPNDTRSAATSLSAGTTRLGEIRGDESETRDPRDQPRPADIDRYAVNLGSPLSSDTAGVITVRAAQQTEDAWSCRLVSPTGDVIDSVSRRDGGCLLQFPGQFSGNYGLEVTMEADARRRYRVTYNEQTALFASQPNNDASAAIPVGLTNQSPGALSIGRISAADPVDRFEATIPSTGGSPEMIARLQMTGPDPSSQARLSVADGSGNQLDVMTPGDTFATSTSAGDAFTFAVTNARGSTLDDADGTYRLLTLAYEPDITTTSTPGATIPDSQPSSALDTVTVSESCASVSRVTVDVNVTNHPARTFLDVILTGPNGTTQTLLTPVDDPTNHVFEPLDGTIPFDYPPINDFTPFYGASGQGDWSLTVVDSSFAYGGTLDSWSLNLNCQ